MGMIGGDGPSCFIVRNCGAALAACTTDRDAWMRSVQLGTISSTRSLVPSSYADSYVYLHVPDGHRFIVTHGGGMDLRNWIGPCPVDLADVPCDKKINDNDWAFGMLVDAIEFAKF